MKSILVLFGIKIFLFSMLFGKELYVSPVNQGDTCTQVFPCSFQSALNKVGDNGESDTIYVSPGVYTLTTTLQVDIRDEKSLTIKALDPNDMPVLDGGGSVRIMNITYLETKVTIDGLIFKNGNAQQGGALYAVGELSQGFTVRNSVFVNNTAVQGGAVYLYSTVSKAFILGNRFEGNGSSEGSALYMPCYSYGQIDFALVERNIFVNNIGDTTAHLTVSGGNCSVTGNLFANNEHTDIPYGVIYMNVFSKAHVINNTIYGSEMVGIYADQKSPTSEINVYNNIIWSTGSIAVAGKSLFILVNTGSVKVFNNIFGQEFFFDPDADGTPDDTVASKGVYLKDTDPSRFNYGSNLFVDPQFVDAAGGVFSLKNTSPAVDSGTEDIPLGAYLGSKDLYKNPRVLDGNRDEVLAVDRGAVEHNPQGVLTGGCSSTPGSVLALWLTIPFLLKRLFRL